MRALVHRESCIQCGFCAALCPKVFALPEGEAAQVIADPVPNNCRAAVQEAAKSCPVDAIHIS